MGSGVAGMGPGSYQPPDMRSSSALLRFERLCLLRRRLLELPVRTITQKCMCKARAGLGQVGLLRAFHLYLSHRLVLAHEHTTNPHHHPRIAHEYATSHAHNKASS